MIVINIVLESGTYREDNIVRYGIDNNMLFIEKNIFDPEKHKTKLVTKYYPLYNIVYYEVFREK